QAPILVVADAGGSGQEYPQRPASMLLLGQVHLVSETFFGLLAGGDPQQRGKAVVVASVRARIPITVAGGQLGGILRRLLGTTVELEEEPEAQWATLVAAVAVGAEPTARAGRCRTPFEQS